MTATITLKPNYVANRIAYTARTAWMQPKEFYDMTGIQCPVDAAMIEAEGKTKQ